MFKWFFKSKTPVEFSDAEKRLEQIKDLLFPPLKISNDSRGKTYYIDSSVDANLHSVYIELQEGINDENTRETVKSAYEQLIKIRAILDAYNDYNTEEASYLMVEDIETGKKIRVQE